MSEQKVIPENCWKCKHAYACDAFYGEGTCKYKVAIEERERNNFSKNGKEADSNGS